MPKTDKLSAAVHTLGCRVNQYESGCVISEFINLGFTIKDFGEICDVYVINTCTVTSGSDKKSKQMIRRAKKTNPDAVVAACGCFTQNNPDVEADIVVGTAGKTKIPALALGIINGSYAKYKSVEPISEYSEYENIHAYSSEKTRAYVKIQDGCDAKCSYCVIPQVRGRVKSRAYEHIYAEVKRFNDLNYHEIVLTGIEISSYKNGLIGLLESLDGEKSLNNIKTIRLSSVDPSLIKKDFIDRLADLDKIANHFHLSLQSGSNRILNSMRRKYNAETVIENTAYAKEKIKGLNLTADIIVGFPGETDEDFERTIAAVKFLDIYHAHVFAYSKRPGTDAADFSCQVPENIKNIRSKVITKTCGVNRENIHKNNMGKIFEVIAEDLYTAKTRNFMDVKIREQILKGTLQKIQIINYNKNYLMGEKI